MLISVPPDLSLAVQVIMKAVLTKDPAQFSLIEFELSKGYSADEAIRQAIIVLEGFYEENDEFGWMNRRFAIPVQLFHYFYRSVGVWTTMVWYNAMYQFVGMAGPVALNTNFWGRVTYLNPFQGPCIVVGVAGRMINADDILDSLTLMTEQYPKCTTEGPLGFFSRRQTLDHFDPWGGDAGLWELLPGLRRRNQPLSYPYNRAVPRGTTKHVSAHNAQVKRQRMTSDQIAIMEQAPAGARYELYWSDLEVGV